MSIALNSVSNDSICSRVTSPSSESRLAVSSSSQAVFVGVHRLWSCSPSLSLRFPSFSFRECHRLVNAYPFAIDSIRHRPAQRAFRRQDSEFFRWFCSLHQWRTQEFSKGGAETSTKTHVYGGNEEESVGVFK